MILLDFPLLPAATVDWQLLTVSENFASPFGANEQTASMPWSARIVATLTWEKLARAEAADLEAFLWECDGPAGRFLLGNQARAQPLGVPLGAPVVDGATNHGGLLATRGWEPNATGLLLRGDLFSVNNEIKMVRAAVNADAGGVAAISFRPALRNVPADGTPVVTSEARGVFRLLDDNQAKFAYRKQTGDYQIVCVETWS